MSLLSPKVRVLEKPSSKARAPCPKDAATLSMVLAALVRVSPTSLAACSTSSTAWVMAWTGLGRWMPKSRPVGSVVLRGLSFA